MFGGVALRFIVVVRVTGKRGPLKYSETFVYRKKKKNREDERRCVRRKRIYPTSSNH